MASKELRYYEVEGAQYPSVTSITGVLDKPPLRFWHGKFGNVECAKKMAEALKIGTALHKYVDDYFTTGISVEPDEDIKIPVNNFDIFMSTYKPELALTEQVVYHPELKYAGTFDGLFKIAGKPVLLDWKTSSSIYDEYELQLEAYYRALLYLVNHGILETETEGMEMWVVRLDKKDEMNIDKDVRKFVPDQGRFGAFCGLLNYFQWAHRDKSKKVKKEK